MALYRKYRPATFAEVVGQEHVTEPLSAALRSGRINHAYLFSGPRGCGKTSSARILARSLNCVEGPTPEPCGVCDSCRALAPGGPGNLDVIELDAASHGNVDDTRELREKAFFAPASSRYRVLIIDEAHMVSNAGFNALLKIVEEPPEHLIFIFATTEPEKVLPTIKSRTHHYPFRLLTPTAMRGLVERICESEGVAVEPAVFPLVIRQGGGSPRDTLSVLDQLVAGSGPEGVSYTHAAALLGVTESSLLDGAVDALAARDGAALFRTVDRVIEVGHDPRRFVSDLLQRLRDIIMVQSVPQAVERGLVDAPGEEAETLARQAEQLGPATLSRLADEVHSGLDSMSGATSPRLLLEILCARLLLPEAEDSFAALSQRVEQLERGAGPIATGSQPAAGQPAAPTGSATQGQGAAPASAPATAAEDGAAPRYVRPSQRRAQQAAQAAAATAAAPRPESPAVPQPEITAEPQPAPETTPESLAGQQERPQAPSRPEPGPQPEPEQADQSSAARPEPQSRPATPASSLDDDRRAESPESRDSADPAVTKQTERTAEQAPQPQAEPQGGKPEESGHAAAAVAAATSSWGEPDPASTGHAATGHAATGQAGAGGAAAGATSDSAGDGDAAPQQAAAPAKALDSEQIRASWPEVRRAVRERSRTLEVMLADAAVARVEGTDLVLTHKTAALANRLNEPHHSAVIAEALGAVFGGSWTSRAEHANAAAAPSGGAGRAPQRAFAAADRPGRPGGQQGQNGPHGQAGVQGHGPQAGQSAPAAQPHSQQQSQPQTRAQGDAGRGAGRGPAPAGSGQSEQRRSEQRPESATPEEPEPSTGWSDGVPLPEEPPADDAPPEEAHDGYDGARGAREGSGGRAAAAAAAAAAGAGVAGAAGAAAAQAAGNASSTAQSGGGEDGQAPAQRRPHWSERAAAHAANNPEPTPAEPEPDESMPEVTEQDMIEEARSGPHNMDHRTPEEMALALLKEHLGAVPLD